ncbi:CRISPR system precrRNA processing endoribonuclease RAMP protein Cas6 [Candidatus Poribacteria bacterium]|nr:CRISPR system precrRNA processing endoribonuclease RAMP protein Cas6 [Candidatus Poribacteria bacterium]
MGIGSCFPDNFLDNLRFVKYRFTLELLEQTRLPKYKGTVLRSGCGKQLKDICCTYDHQRHNAECRSCEHNHSCIYSYLFETPGPPNAQYLDSQRDVPRPYIIEPSPDIRQSLYSHERLDFDLILFGKAIEYFPYFLVSFINMGESKDRNVGLGDMRSKYRVLRVTTVDIYDEDWHIVYTPHRELRGEYIETDCISARDILESMPGYPISNQLHIRFLTPMNIRIQRHKSNDNDHADIGLKKARLVEALDFPSLLRPVLKQISAMTYFHCQSDTLDTLKVRELLSKAEQVQILKDKTHVKSFHSVKRTIKGFLGDVIYKGDFEPFLPFMYIGQWIYPSKNRVIGFGKYELIFRMK